MAEWIKVKPELNSLARLRPSSTNPQILSMREKTSITGLRRAGFPEE
jgi:hypothetical protein